MVDLDHRPPDLEPATMELATAAMFPVSETIETNTFGREHCSKDFPVLQIVDSGAQTQWVDALVQEEGNMAAFLILGQLMEQLKPNLTKSAARRYVQFYNTIIQTNVYTQQHI